MQRYLLENMYHQAIIELLVKSPGLPSLLAKIGVVTVHLFSTLWKDENTPGNALFNIEYVKASLLRKGAHYILKVVQVLCENFKDHPSYRYWVTCVFINWVAFFVYGKYRDLPERVAGLELVVCN